jgi:signal transduction histidine kinase/CheY-like chemotaxis protein
MSDEALVSLDRFEALRSLAAALAGALAPDDVARAVAEHSLPLTGARGGFVAVTDEDGRELEVVRALGPHEAPASGCRFPVGAGVPTAEAVRSGELVWVASVEERIQRYPAWNAGRWSGYAAWAAAPLQTGDRVLGALLFCFATPMRFDDDKRGLIRTVATMCAQAMDRALLYNAERMARARAEDAERRLWFLAEASRLLSGSLDYLTVLQSLARLALPYLAECCAVDLHEEGTLRRVAFEHVDGEKARRGWELSRRFPVSLEDAHGVAHVYRTQEPQLVPRLDEVDLMGKLRDPQQLEMVRELEVRSLVAVPIRTQNRVLGVLTWASGPSGRNYDAADLSLAEEMGIRAALAIDNARHYMQEAQARQEADRAFAAARQADQRKDEFLAMLGHELRNPLAPIHTAVELLKMRGRDDRELPIIERQVRHLARLVDDLMDVSRVTRGKIALEREPLDLRQVMSRAVEMASPLYEQKGQHLQLLLPETPVPVEGDAIRLAQVTANLLTNAAKYTPAGGHVALKLGCEAGQAVIVVSDDGMGISPALLPTIFDLFVQGPRSVDRAQGGLGIGLTLVKSLVELHGGTVEARSGGSGMGSDFVVRLPLGSDLPAHAPSPPPPPVEARRKRVLIVDDNADALELLSTILGDVGYTVHCAVDAVEALRAIDDFQPHVALLDIGLPVMDGYELAARLRERTEPPRLVAITGYGQTSDRTRSDRAGFVAHLTKPVDLDLLIAAIEGR